MRGRGGKMDRLLLLLFIFICLFIFIYIFIFYFFNKKYINYIIYFKISKKQFYHYFY